MAINKPAIIDTVFQGMDTAAKNLLPTGIWSEDSELKDYDYDPEKARALLKEAGLMEGATIKVLYKQAQQVMHDQAQAVMIAHSILSIPVRKEVTGYEVDLFDKHIFYQVGVKK